jgi:hypothetical protein
MLQRTLIALVFALSVALGTSERAAADAVVAGEVVAMGGQCFVAVGDQRKPLKVGDSVHAGETLEIPEGSKLKLRMTDGSVISAAPGTRVTIETFDTDGATRREAKLSLAGGLLRAVVSTMSQTSHFEIDTATGVAAVRSTDWFVLSDRAGMQVGVLEGAVSLTSNATHRSVNIPARWGARLEPGKDPVPARVWSKAEFDDVIAKTDVK